MWENVVYEDVMTIEPTTETLVEQVLPEEIADVIYSGWSGETIDFGGGVVGITCRAVLDACGGSPYKLSRKIKGLKRKEADMVVSVCQKALREEPLR